jgi:hypothetical protein
MSDLATLLGQALDKLTTLNPGTLTFGGESISVFKSFLRNVNRQMNDFGYDDSFDDLYVLAKPADISSWNLQPLKSTVTLDGVSYKLGRSTTTTPGYVTLWLRRDV